ncbi:TetR/AcrR family transcriptional regulator C-terminal domain-containing protein [Streptomyces sp. NBC_00335]|uniref:TetR/AcrR family transcriptional regulator C-terminal domain-containing protein n=1 Tax=unclassified Streptomyces TaxID=2593676 RepID=UPI00225B1F3B|nr:MULTISPECIES: TetR/AcrR family transcriptional regulator C-terminal domain-containing protein [unclassified Streptomyces]MCX5404963.1 TetR/AcrR family transcriptional regulator C-terminal domain-containing protein [Streptomyces sp. NBC_00086]
MTRQEAMAESTHKTTAKATEKAADKTADKQRIPLNRDRVLRAAVALADATGIDALSMRRLAQELGVVPMALYKHVANKEELLDGMTDAVVGEIDPPATGPDWQSVVRGRILSARQVLLRHPWAARVIESRTGPTPAVLAYLDSMAGCFRGGGLSADLTHHVMHAMGSRLLGFSQELFDTSGASGTSGPPDPALAAHFPHIAELAATAAHDDGSTVGGGCDDQFEFEFALDLLLDGFEGLRRRGWTSAR